MQYIRAWHPGGTCFFTVNLAERSRTLLMVHVNHPRGTGGLMVMRTISGVGDSSERWASRCSAQPAWLNSSQYHITVRAGRRADTGDEFSGQPGAAAKTMTAHLN